MKRIEEAAASPLWPGKLTRMLDLWGGGGVKPFINSINTICFGLDFAFISFKIFEIKLDKES